VRILLVLAVGFLGLSKTRIFVTLIIFGSYKKDKDLCGEMSLDLSISIVAS